MLHCQHSVEIALKQKEHEQPTSRDGYGLKGCWAHETNTKIHAGWRLTLFLFCTIPACNVGTQAADTIYTKKVLKLLEEAFVPSRGNNQQPYTGLANAQQLGTRKQLRCIHTYIRSNNIDALVPPPPAGCPKAPSENRYSYRARPFDATPTDHHKAQDKDSPNTEQQLLRSAI